MSTQVSALLDYHLRLSRVLAALHPGHPLSAARLAYGLGEAELARALLARSGSLLDSGEARRELKVPPAAELLAQAQAARHTLPTPPQAHLSDTQQEMYIRVLAGLLVSDAQQVQSFLERPAAPLSGTDPGLWRLPALPEQQRWPAGLALADQQPVHWVTASWGGRWACANCSAPRGREALPSWDHLRRLRPP
ncbi:hypothetical protein ACFQBZ_18330 [Deinococcus radiophilus]